MADIPQVFDVLVVGAGPAGMAAAWAAASSGASVGVVDDNPSPGGQIWRSESAHPSTPEAVEWYRRISSVKIAFVHGAKVVDHPAEGVLLAETWDGVSELRYRKLILATGARERFLPFPGWTLPNVMGAGGLQALVKSGLPVAGKRVVVAGSGPLLLAVAAYLKKHGAAVMLIAEQAPWQRLAWFAAALLARPAKAMQTIRLKRELGGVPYLTSCWPVAAEGEGKLERVTLRRGKKTWSVACDYIACGFHLVPNTELAELLGCAIENGCVRVDQWQQTSREAVYCAGEPTGIGGLELSLVEGQIAGFAATDQKKSARALIVERKACRRFARQLDRTFALREELKSLAAPDTIVCRCEDVPLARLRENDSWRAAKLETRCGMGPCQGRVCGSATEFLFGWRAESVRPPLFPARVEVLAMAEAAAQSGDTNRAA